MGSSHNNFRSIDTIDPIRPPLPDGVLTTLQWTGFAVALTIAAIGLFQAIYNRNTEDGKAGRAALIVAAPAAFLLSITATGALTTAAALLAAKLNHPHRYY